MISPSATVRTLDPEFWREIAGETISSHTQVLLEGTDAVVYADSPVWAHSVNQKRLTLLDSMHRKGLEVDTIRVRNQPPEPRRTKVLFPQPPVMVMPKPKISPPIIAPAQPKLAVR